MFAEGDKANSPALRARMPRVGAPSGTSRPTLLYFCRTAKISFFSGWDGGTSLDGCGPSGSICSHTLLANLCRIALDYLAAPPLDSTRRLMVQEF